MIDSIGLALIQKQLDHISRQMGWIMGRTARSPIFNQSHDYSCFIGDRHGNVVSQADGLPIHTGGGSFAMKAVLRDVGALMHDGDVYILSDPYEAGNNHLPDWTIIRPIFVRGELLGFCCNRAHQSDIGGGAAGTYNSAATEIFHEGIRLPVMRLIDAGKLREDLWRLLLLNSRCPDLLDGDLRSMLGSTKIGAERVAEAFLTLPDNTAVGTYLDGILDYADRLMRDEISRLPDGVYVGEDNSDTDCFSAADIRVRVRITVSGEKMCVDLTGSSPQIRGFKNSSLANTHSSVYMAVLSCLNVHLPKNDGAFRPIQIIAPEGTIVNARPPAAMTMNTIHPAIDIAHACWKALAVADPQRACAGWGKGVHGISSGASPSGSTFVMYHWHGLPGTGAVEGRDGFATMGNLVTLCGLRTPNVEAYEQLYPVRIHCYEFRCDAAGAGMYRGGVGMNYSAEFNIPTEYSFRGEGARGLVAYGINNGCAGAPGTLSLVALDGERLETPQYGVRGLPPHRITIASAGGGGFGDPYRRSLSLVLRDVEDGVVSREKAQELYGVVVSGAPPMLDAEATAALRGFGAHSARADALDQSVTG